MFTIGGVQKTTLLDFPGKVAAIVFTQGCNFRCGYCHNPQLLEMNRDPYIDTKEFMDFLQTRHGKLDGVVITGGEPTLQSGLYDFIKGIKSLGFAVKLDTNGTNPSMIEQLIDDNMLDYTAMDIKAPLEKYQNVVYSKINLSNITKSINLIMNSGIDYEFRTTVIKSQLSCEDFEQIGYTIKGAKRYYLQKYVPSEILDKALISETSYTDDEFRLICQKLKEYVQFVDYR